jgi:hypothetical protein
MTLRWNNGPFPFEYTIEKGKFVHIHLQHCTDNDIWKVFEYLEHDLEWKQSFKYIPIHDLFFIISIENSPELNILPLFNYHGVNRSLEFMSEKVIEFSIVECDDLIEIDNELGRFINLQKLEIRFTPLSRLPESIGQLVRLKQLIIDGNKLHELPETIRNLIELKEINVSENKLAHLPDGIGYLTNLTYLNIYDNKIITLPETIINLTRLDKLDIRENNIIVDTPDVFHFLNDVPELIGKFTSNVKTIKTDENNIFIIMGHGFEDVVYFEERTILEEGYQVITFCECGQSLDLYKICPLYSQFINSSADTAYKLLHPELLKREYPTHTIHIYKPGSSIPKIKTTLEMVWNKFKQEPKLPDRALIDGETKEDHLRIKHICKSGIYKYPIKEESLFDKNTDIMCDKSGWCSTIPSQDTDIIQSSILKSKEGSLYIKPSLSGYYSLDDIMRKFGPGTYYLPICRTATCDNTEDTYIDEYKYADDDDEENYRNPIQLTRQLSVKQQIKQGFYGRGKTKTKTKTKTKKNCKPRRNKTKRNKNKYTRRNKNKRNK